MSAISIITSVYNAQDYIEYSIISILNQTFKDFEYIIINDGSSDSTKLILDRYALLDKRIKVIHQENLGLTKSLNKAISLSKSKYIARLDADDIAEPKRLEIQYNYLQSNPQVDLVASNYYLIDSDGNRLLYRKLPNSNLVRQILSKHNLIAHSTVMFRKTSFDIAGGYNESYRYSQDWDLWQRIKSIEIIYEPLINWRIHSSNINFSKNNSIVIYDNYFLKNIITMHLEQDEIELAKKHSKELSNSFIKIFYYILCRVPNSILKFYLWKIRIYLKKDIKEKIKLINKM